MYQAKETDNQSRIEIIRLPVSEWQTYKEIRLRALKEDPQAFSSLYIDQANYPDDYWKNRLAIGDFMLFAKLDGKVVGMMAGYLSGDNNEKHTADIVSVYVVSEARGKGASKELLEELLRRLKAVEVATVNLSVNKDQLAAVNLYTKFGFQITGEEESLMGDGLRHTELLMSKKL